MAVRRRDFIQGIAGLAVEWPLIARAQQSGPMRRVGVLEPLAADDPEAQARSKVFREALQQLGWTVGQNIQLEYRAAGGDPDRLRIVVAELIALAPDVILSQSSNTLAALLQATRTIPIVFAVVADPVGAGYVDSLAYPGGNATGFINFEYSIAGKWLELLKEIAPGVTHVAVLREHCSRARPVRRYPECGRAAWCRITPRQCARRWRDRRSRHGICRRFDWRPDCNGQSSNHASSRTDHRPRRPPSAAGSLQHSAFYQCWRSDVLWLKYRRPVPPRGSICRSYPERRETGELARTVADQIRSHH